MLLKNFRPEGGMVLKKSAPRGPMLLKTDTDSPMAIRTSSCEFATHPRHFGHHAKEFMHRKVQLTNVSGG